MVRAILTNPLDQDPVLKDLLKKLDRIETRRGFARWKKHFLEQFESHLEGVSITKAGQKYHAFARRLDRLVLLLKALERLMSAGDLSPTRVTVKSRQSLTELQKQLTGMIEHTQALVPGTLEQENAAGYTKFDMGAVLVRDGFVEYDRLCLCRDVLWHMRAALLLQVADRQLLEEMERYKLHLEAFCGIMGTDLGLHGAMLKCRNILRAEDEEFYQYENEDGVMVTVRTGTGSSKSSKSSHYTTSEYDDEYYTHDEEEDDADEEDEDDEDEEDDDSESSNVVEIYGMEIPLRLSKARNNSDGEYCFDDDSNVSELSDDSSWSWSLQVPAPPKKTAKQRLVVSTPGLLPPAPLSVEEDKEQEEEAASPPATTTKHVIRERITLIPPPGPPQAPPRSRFPDPEPTELLNWTINDYYHGDAEAWKIAQQERDRLERGDDSSSVSPTQSPRKPHSGADDDTESPTNRKKIVLKARLRKKGTTSHSRSDSSEETAGAGDAASLDDSSSRVVLRPARRGGRKSTPAHAANGTSTTTATDDPPSNDDGQSEARSSTPSRAESELDNVRHAGGRRVRRQKSSGSRSSKSSELRRMARRAAAIRRREEGGDDNASTGSRRSMGSRRSRGSRGSRGSRSSRKKDPLHNLLFSKKNTIVVHHNHNKDIASLGDDDELDNDAAMMAGVEDKKTVETESTSAGDEEPQSPPPRSRDKLQNPPSLDNSPLSAPDTPEGKNGNADDDDDSFDEDYGDKERRKLCYSWYGRLGQPTREAFKRRIRENNEQEQELDGLTEADVDLLPWIHGGARINLGKMTKLLTR